ncbi:pseudoazurin (plasmid) [Sphingobium sp. SCG-1]|uniref:pseudoazurin n=1 Tax=Sphingobium sp. SCG-1 TaxID=2072936 RepID=UPI000CD68A06|nr:pseudoazurin [Sphingobium sp. SCG-1]AUW60621.1 pseudoazurin [Sphingobium sp. SCG-1]
MVDLRMKLYTYLVAGALGIAASAPAMAKEVVIQMKNQGAAGMMVFEPAFVKVGVGDSIRFVPTDKSHNVESMPEILPTGATPVAGKMNQELVVKFEKGGVYGFKCKPHYSMGMVALVQVGSKPSNLAAAKAAKLPGLAQKRMSGLWPSVK